MTRDLDRRDFLGAALAGAAVLSGIPFARSQSPGARLKKAVYIGMLPRTMSYEDRFKLAREAGFEAVECETVTDPAVAGQIKEAASRAGITIHSVMNSDHWKYPLSSADPETVDKCMHGLETSIRNAKLWGAETVLLVPAVVDPKTGYRDAYTRSQARIRKILPLASDLRVIIGIENVWNKFLLSPLEFAGYIDEFRSPWIRAYFDVGNIMLYGYPQDWIRTLGKRIVKLHLKDFNTNSRQFVDLREGSIDWPEVMKSLSDIEYRGYATVELKAGDEAYLRDVSSRVDRIFAG